MMAGKAELFDDKETRGKILESRSPKQIKELGRRVKGFEHATWDKAKFSIVLNGNWCKFSQNMELKAFLLSTGDAILAEASPYDGIWGIRMQADARAGRRQSSEVARTKPPRLCADGST